MHPFFVYFLSLRGSNATVAIRTPRVIARSEATWQSASFAMRCIARLAEPQGNGFPGGELPQRGKRGHSGVHQCVHWFGMTEKTYPLYVIARERQRPWQSPAVRFPVHRSSRNAATWPREIPTGLTALGMTKKATLPLCHCEPPLCKGGLSKLLLNDLHSAIFSFLRPCYLRF